MKTNMKISVLASRIALLVALSGATMVQAQTVVVETSADEITRVESVSYQDLKLSDREDAKALYERLHQTSKRVCGPRPLHAIRAILNWKTCYSNALDDAVAQVGSVQLAEIHHGDDAETSSFTIADTE